MRGQSRNELTRIAPEGVLKDLNHDQAAVAPFASAITDAIGKQANCREGEPSGRLILVDGCTSKSPSSDPCLLGSRVSI